MDSSLRDAVARELGKARQDTSDGRTALILAARIDSGEESGSALAALVGKLQETLDRAVKARPGRSRLAEIRGMNDGGVAGQD